MAAFFFANLLPVFPKSIRYDGSDGIFLTFFSEASRKSFLPILLSVLSVTTFYTQIITEKRLSEYNIGGFRYKMLPTVSPTVRRQYNPTVGGILTHRG